MKTYWMKSLGFANAYNLAWADDKTEIEYLEKSPEWVRITRLDAEGYCYDENQRRKNGEGGYADNMIRPFETLSDPSPAIKGYIKNDYIWERSKK